MITVTLKIADVDLTNGSFHCFVGNHGFPIELRKLKEMASKIRHEEISQEMVYFICVQKIAARAKLLGVAIKDLPLQQIRNAIETEVEI